MQSASAIRVSRLHGIWPRLCVPDSCLTSPVMRPHPTDSGRPVLDVVQTERMDLPIGPVRARPIPEPLWNLSSAVAVRPYQKVMMRNENRRPHVEQLAPHVSHAPSLHLLISAK